MARYVPDVLSHRWVIISEGRVQRPDNFAEKKADVCPFCPGNEQMSAPEVFRIGEGMAEQPGWQVRVVSNKFPITDFHEVIIHSPDCDREIDELPPEAMENVLKAYRQRYNFYREKGQVMIFCNHGEQAGASIKHPHSQLVVIPFQINLDLLSCEPIANVIEQNNDFTVYCPDFSQWPYEVWIAAKETKGVFGDITDEQITNLSHILQKMIQRLRQVHATAPLSSLPFGFNYYIHPKENWYLRIVPRFIHRAGFELGTGLSVNIVDPIDAARAYQGVDQKTAAVMDKLKSLT